MLSIIEAHCMKNVLSGSLSCLDFFFIRTEDGDLHSKSLYSVQMHENRMKKTPNTFAFHAVSVLPIFHHI